MKAQLLMLSAAGLVLASAAQAAPADVERFVAKAQQKAAARLAAEGVDLRGSSVRLKVHVQPDGRIGAAQVVQSSGSRELDETVTGALRNLRVEPPPVAIVGRQVTFDLGRPQVRAAAEGGES